MDCEWRRGRPAIDNANSRVQQLQKLGAAGLEALQYLHSGKSAPGDWKAAQLELVTQAEKPDTSALKLPWLGSYRALILAAADAGAAKSGNADEWKQKVLNDAAKNEPKQKYTW